MCDTQINHHGWQTEKDVHIAAPSHFSAEFSHILCTVAGPLLKEKNNVSII